MKALTLILILLGAVNLLSAQTLTLKECQSKAREASPLVNQFELNQTAEKLQQLNLGRNNLPKMQVIGQASYQSDVFQLPIEFPGFMPPIIPSWASWALLICETPWRAVT